MRKRGRPHSEAIPLFSHVPGGILVAVAATVAEKPALKRQPTQPGRCKGRSASNGYRRNEATAFCRSWAMSAKDSAEAAISSTEALCSWELEDTSSAPAADCSVMAAIDSTDFTTC